FLQNNLFIQNLTPRSYSVLVAKEGFWPWFKKVEVEPKMVAEARAFMVPQDPKWDIIANGRKFVSIKISPDQKTIAVLDEKGSGNYHLLFYQPETNSILTENGAETKSSLSFSSKNINISWLDNKAFIQSQSKITEAEMDFEKNLIKASLSSEMPQKSLNDSQSQSKEKKIVSSNEKTAISINSQNKEILAEWLDKEDRLPYYFESKEMILLKSQFRIDNIAFFPYREDVIIFAADQQGIFALEFDNRNNSRLVQPIYKGKNPYFVVSEKDGKIYLIDESVFFSTKL
ncbi:MAG: hypothetical protein AAB926_01955, partial [Patescibacteria group bacterium]